MSASAKLPPLLPCATCTYVNCVCLKWLRVKSTTAMQTSSLLGGLAGALSGAPVFSLPKGKRGTVAIRYKTKALTSGPAVEIVRVTRLSMVLPECVPVARGSWNRNQHFSMAAPVPSLVVASAGLRGGALPPINGRRSPMRVRLIGAAAHESRAGRPLSKRQELSRAATVAGKTGVLAGVAPGRRPPHTARAVGADTEQAGCVIGKRPANWCHAGSRYAGVANPPRCSHSCAIRESTVLMCSMPKASRFFLRAYVPVCT